MTYVTDQMRDALAGHRLRQVCNSGGVRVFRMAAPGTRINTLHAADLVFLPDRIGITGDCRTGLWSKMRLHFGWWCDVVNEQQLADGFDCADAPHDLASLVAIQRRFAELWAERVARIEAIVAGWGWIPNEAGDAWSLRKRGEGTPSIVFAHGAWHIARRSGSGGTVGIEGDGDAAKLAARAAVLAQAIEHPELWYCQEVEQ